MPVTKGLIMSDEICIRCGDPSHVNRIIDHCRECRDELRKSGICVMCGVEPKAGTSKSVVYCKACSEKATKKFNERAAASLESYQAKYRGQDHRENTRETKHGRD